MDYKVIITERAEQQLDHIVKHLMTRYHNNEAAGSVLEDTLKAFEKLEYMAGAMPKCGDSYLASKGYYKIALEKHRYVILYQINDECAIVGGIFHMLENYQNKL